MDFLKWLGATLLVIAGLIIVAGMIGLVAGIIARGFLSGLGAS